MKPRLFIFLLPLFFLACCGTDGPSVSYYDFPGKVWKRFDNPVIAFDIASPGIFYDMYVVMEYEPSLRFDAFPVTVIMYSPSGEIRSRDISMDQEKYAVSDGLIRIPLRKEYAFIEKGQCSFEIENRSQKVQTHNLIRIGIEMIRAE